jgi:hypothetical protein
MIPPIDLSTLPGPAQKIASEDAPQKLRLMAAKGIVPGLRPDAILVVLTLLAKSADAEVAQQASSTLDALPDPLLKGALDADLPEAAVLAIAERYTGRIDVLERVVRMPRVPLEAIEYLAEHGNESVVELVATNEERVLRHPRLIEIIYMNRRARMSTANRLVELAVRNGVDLGGIPAWKEVAVAIQGELIAEPSDEPLPEDEAFWETQHLADELQDDGLEDAYYSDDEGKEHVEDKLKPLYQRIGEMTTSEKVRSAMLGSREERLLLIREQNKIVAAAAARSPLMQESEVRLVASSRSVVEEVLRIISTNPEWLKSYSIKKALVENPKTPIGIAQRLVNTLRENDLRRISKSKNVSGAVQQAARRHLDRRKT